MKAPASALGLMMDGEEQLRGGRWGGSRFELEVKDILSCKFFPLASLACTHQFNKDTKVLGMGLIHVKPKQFL